MVCELADSSGRTDMTRICLKILQTWCKMFLSLESETDKEQTKLTGCDLDRICSWFSVEQR